MRVDLAKPDDYWDITLMLQNFASCSPMTAHHCAEYPRYDACRRLGWIAANNGIILIARNGSTPVGMLIASVVSDPWLPHVQTLRELAWWVEPEYRGGTAGIRMLKQFTHIADAMLEANLVSAVVLTTLETSQLNDLTPRGWKRVETNWMRGN